MNYIARLTAWTQSLGFLVSLTGFMGATFVVVSGSAKLDPTSEKLAYALLGAWGANLGQQISFFYQRHRSESNPDLAPHPPARDGGITAAGPESQSPSPNMVSPK